MHGYVGILWAAKLGVTFVAYSPLGQGFLTGALGSTEALAADDFRRNNPRFQGEAFTQNQRLADALASFAERKNATAAQMALAWLLSKHEHVVPIPGAKRPGRLPENAAAVGMTLSVDEIATLDSLISPEAVVGDRYTVAGMKGVERAG